MWKKHSNNVYRTKKQKTLHIKTKKIQKYFVYGIISLQYYKTETYNHTIVNFGENCWEG